MNKVLWHSQEMKWVVLIYSVHTNTDTTYLVILRDAKREVQNKIE